MFDKKPNYLDNLDKLHLYPKEKVLKWMESKPPGETMSDWEWAAYCLEWEKQLRWTDDR